MDIQSTQKIRCEAVSISPGSDGPRSTLFFHRIAEEDTQSIDQVIPNCFIHSNIVATVQCVECVKDGIPLLYSYHCSNKCFLDAWKIHDLYHRRAKASKLCNKDTKVRGKLDRCNSWPPVDMVSWFDEKLEVVIPTGRKWVNRAGPSNALIPLADVGFSFKLQSASLNHLQAAVHAEDAFATYPIIQRKSLSPRSIIWLPYSKKPENFDITKKVSKVGNFSVLTYNILSDIYVYMDKYSYCPQWALKWEYRQKNLLHELIQYRADILCLQEVQSDHFDAFFKPELKKVGYSVVYKPKNNKVFTENGYTIDGCATFFRCDIFKEVEKHELEYSQSALSLMEKLEPSLRDHATYRLCKDNLAVAVVLEIMSNATGTAASLSRLCVVNTHIYADKDFPDIKLLQ